MNKLLLIAAVFASLSAACKSGASQAGSSRGSAGGSLDFSAALGKNWSLAEVDFQGDPAKKIAFTREELVAEGFPDIFTLRFSEEQLNVVGAPNRCFAPYELGANQAISIKTRLEPSWPQSASRKSSRSASSLSVCKTCTGGILPRGSWSFSPKALTKTRRRSLLSRWIRKRAGKSSPVEARFPAFGPGEKSFVDRSGSRKRSGIVNQVQ